MDTHYLIGAFSERSGVSKRMLRHYDKLNLLKPIALDDVNGYRYYSEDQVQEIKRIQLLQGLGFTLTAIKALLAQPLDAHQFARELKEKEVELTQVSDEVKSSLLLLKRTIQYLENHPLATLPSVDQLLHLEGGIPMSIHEPRTLIDLKALMNRDVFVEKIESILEADQNDDYHFITCDIDHFMHVNDFDGFAVGDAVIANVFTIIIQKVYDILEGSSSNLLIARLGGDECSIFVKNAQDNTVISCVDAILREVRAFDFQSIGCTRDIRVSCGIASCHGKPVHIAQLKDKSAMALMDAKRNGRNQYVFLSDNALKKE